MSCLPKGWTDRLTIELATFDDASQSLLLSQQRAFETCMHLLQDDPLSHTEVTIQYRYVRQRARTFLIDVYEQLDSDAFLLCALAIPITLLSHAQLKTTFTQYRNWWNSVLHPLGLKRIADQLCKGISFTPGSTSRKRQLKEEAQGIAFAIHREGQYADGLQIPQINEGNWRAMTLTQ